MAVSDRSQRLFALWPGVRRACASGPDLSAAPPPTRARLAARGRTGAASVCPLLGRLALALLLASGPVQAAPAGSAGAACAAAQRAIGEQASRLRAAAPRLEALLLGEIHTSAADHAWQLATLEAAQQAQPRLSLALEMVPAARQPVLDRYSAGQINEQTFLKQVGWQEVWGHDADLYLPLLRWARQRGVPLLALNAEPDLVKRVRRQGLAAIPRPEREGIGAPVSAGPAYRRRLETAWRGHGGGDGPLTAAQAVDLQRFIDSQLLRDRAMAERIAAAHRRDPGRLVVALIGRGHLEDGDGVPRQLADLGVGKQLSLTRIAPPDGCGPAPARARLGAYLESDGGAVWVRRVAPGSAAAAAGLRPGDRILELNGLPVDHAGQVIRGVRLQPDGAPLQLTIERAGRRLRLQLNLPASTEPRQASRDNGVWVGDRSRPAPRPAPLA